MREIKFRAWDKEAQKMSYSTIEHFDDMLAFRFEHFETDNPVFMQYTGLKDKNGKEIYEGDIVRIWGGEYWYGYWEVNVKGEVVFEDFSYGVKSDDRFYPFNIAFEAYDYEIEVIGNVYETTGLLGDQVG